jgi:hypothetical protein
VKDILLDGEKKEDIPEVGDDIFIDLRHFSQSKKREFGGDARMLVMSA